ncbi:UNVERIFIED_ORG: hypothetical protein ABIB13_003623 [Arthrobacter sp. UYEF2]
MIEQVLTGPMAGAAVMVWVPMRTMTVRSGLSVRTSLLIMTPVVSCRWRAMAM